MEKNKIDEEVTITPVIADIEKLVNKVFRFIIGLFKSIGNLIFSIFKTFVLKFRLFFFFMLLGGTVALVSLIIFPKTYKSSLTLILNVYAQSQLESDVNYLNALIKRDKIELLSEFLSISKEEAKSIKKFEITPYVSFVEQLDVYNSIYSRMDSNIQKTLTLSTMINAENEMYLTDKFIISIETTKEDVFSKLEKPFIDFIERVPELQAMRLEKIESLKYQQEILEKELEDLDTLKSVYNRAMIIQAGGSGNKASSTTIQLAASSENQPITALDIHEQYISYSKLLRETVDKLQKLQTSYLIHSHLTGYGTRSNFGLGVRLVIGVIGGVIFGFLFLFLKVSLAKVEESNV